jgi:hypothetical protein
MKCNVGKADRTARVILGLVLLGTGFYYQSLWGLVGLVPLLTAAVGFCPLYPLFKVNTCSTDSKP